ncbi:MAG: sulfurtransferase TusA family protein [Oxalobacter sp.]|jgi:tRNA 2-thiouridine synthesizing protein A|nr:sulfurtransferase TusA family protein [Oxalobacter sp.]MBR5999867.1 sulfurtransferase TusA family protein [Oxalobacter sp.]
MGSEVQPVDLTVDACGTKCPMPILKAKKALSNMASGQLLKVLTTDPGAVGDFQFFGQQTGNTVVGQTETDGVYAIVIKRK